LVSRATQGSVIESAPKPNGAADTLPENAPPPWVLTPGNTDNDGRYQAIMEHNDALSHQLEESQQSLAAYREEVDRLSQQVAEMGGGGDVDLVKENSELQMKVKELLLAAEAAAPAAAAAAQSSGEGEQMWLAEKEVLMSMMTEKEVTAETLADKVAELEKALEEAAAGGGAAAEATAAAARATAAAAAAEAAGGDDARGGGVVWCVGMGCAWQRPRTASFHKRDTRGDSRPEIRNSQPQESEFQTRLKLHAGCASIRSPQRA
jgi:hypothetical protein